MCMPGYPLIRTADCSAYSGKVGGIEVRSATIANFMRDVYDGS